MYEFLESLNDEQHFRLVKKTCPAGTPILSRNVPREVLSNLIFAIHGFDLLSSKTARRIMLESLDESKLQSWAASLGKTDSLTKRFDLALKLSNQTWSSKSQFAKRFSYIFDVPWEYLPDKRISAPGEEVIEPWQRLPPLFDFQQEIVDKLGAELSKSARAVLMQLPTGAGKTRTTMHALSNYILSVPIGKQVPTILWLAHTEELCEQAVESFCRVWRDRGNREVRVVRFWGNYNPEESRIRNAVVVSSYNKMHSFIAKRRQDHHEFLDQLRVVVVDEAHKALAPTMQALLDRIGAGTSKHLLGLTATPGRSVENIADNKKLVTLFQGRLVDSEILGADPIQTLQSRGILSNIERIEHQSNVNISPIGDSNDIARSLDVDISNTTLARLAKNRERNALIVKLVREEIEAGRQVLVFACSVKHSSELAVQCVVEGLQAASVDCYMRILVRRQVIDSFRRGDMPVLFNYGVLSTGFDVPNIGTIIIARPTSSIVLYSQMLGRGLRGEKVGGTANCRIIDIKDNFESFGDVAAVYSHFESFWA